jgi:hypothetical protein
MLDMANLSVRVGRVRIIQTNPVGTTLGMVRADDASHAVAAWARLCVPAGAVIHRAIVLPRFVFADPSLAGQAPTGLKGRFIRVTPPLARPIHPRALAIRQGTGARRTVREIFVETAIAVVVVPVAVIVELIWRIARHLLA